MSGDYQTPEQIFTLKPGVNPLDIDVLGCIVSRASAAVTYMICEETEEPCNSGLWAISGYLDQLRLLLEAAERGAES